MVVVDTIVTVAVATSVEMAEPGVPLAHADTGKRPAVAVMAIAAASATLPMEEVVVVVVVEESAHTSSRMVHAGSVISADSPMAMLAALAATRRSAFNSSRKVPVVMGNVVVTLTMSNKRRYERVQLNGSPPPR